MGSGFSRHHALVLLFLLRIQVMQDSTYFLQSFSTCGHQNVRCTSSEVLLIPKCPASMWPWHSRKIETRTSSGTKILFLYHSRHLLPVRLVPVGEGTLTEARLICNSRSPWSKREFPEDRIVSGDADCSDSLNIRESASGFVFLDPGL